MLRGVAFSDYPPPPIGLTEDNMIITNKIECLECGDIIESTYRHDFKWCNCGSCAVDGGKDYLRRVGKNWKELSTFKDDGPTSPKEIQAP